MALLPVARASLISIGIWLAFSYLDNLIVVLRSAAVFVDDGRLLDHEHLLDLDNLSGANGLDA
jgi:hypothetical protein